METENFQIAIGQVNVQTFEVRDYIHHEKDKCKFEIHKSGQLILSLEPDGDFLRVCKNPGELDEETIHLICDKIESYHL